MGCTCRPPGLISHDCTEHSGDATFAIAVEVVRRHEARLERDGSWTFFDKNPRDPGGATAWGISKTIRDRYSLTPADCGIPDFSDDSLKTMTWEAAASIYRRFIWDPMKLWRIEDQTEATKILDCAVNLTRGASIRFAQRACLAEYPTVAVDGLIGPETVNAINRCCRFRWLRSYGEQMAAFYRGRVYGDASLGLVGDLSLACWLSPPTGNWLARAAWGVPAEAHP